MFAQACGDGSAGTCLPVGLGRSTGSGAILNGRCASGLRHDASMRPAGHQAKAFRGIEEARRGKRSRRRGWSGGDRIVFCCTPCVRQGCSPRHGRKCGHSGACPIYRHGWSRAGTVNAARRQPPDWQPCQAFYLAMQHHVGVMRPAGCACPAASRRKHARPDSEIKAARCVRQKPLDTHARPHLARMGQEVRHPVTRGSCSCRRTLPRFRRPVLRHAQSGVTLTDLGYR